MGDHEHLLTKYDEEDKVAYLSIVASMAAADNEVKDIEISNLRDLCKKANISPEGLGKVIATTEDPNQTVISEYVDKLSGSELRFSLLTDLYFMALADENISNDEIIEIESIADALSIKPEQTESILKYVKAVHRAQNSGDSKEVLKKLGGDVSASLAATGVPVGAVAVAGAAGLSGPGIMSGLAALGLGMGATGGLAAVAGIGVGTYYGVRWLYKRAVGA